MGLAAAKQLSAKGANIAIVARNKDKLTSALAEIRSSALSTDQKFEAFSADLSSPEAAAGVVAAVTAWNGAAPDTVWIMHGASDPRLFIETTPEALRSQMDINYFGAANVAHAILQQWLSPSQARLRKDRHLVFTSSTLAFFPIIGYAPYSPAKAALRSLCDTLAQEVLLYSDSVHLHTVFPGGIDTPGFANENINKPAVTKKIEEPDPVQSADEVAKGSIKGLEKGEYLIVTNFIGKAMRSIGWASSRRSNWFTDTVFGNIVNSIFYFIKSDMDDTVRKWGYKEGHPSKYAKTA